MIGIFIRRRANTELHREGSNMKMETEIGIFPLTRMLVILCQVDNPG